MKQVGRVVATEARANTAYEFYFWTPEGSDVGIGTLVAMRAEATGEDRPPVEVYGVVVEGWSWSDTASAMHDYLGFQGDPGLEPATIRPEVRFYRAAVLRREPEEPVQPVPAGLVYLADDAAVSKALRMDAYADTSGVVAGAYQNGDQLSPVYLDADFLLGPEAAHVSLTGVSGLATKTSAIEFLLQSIFSSPAESVACVCFNVKGHDMLFLDYPADAPTDAALGERYEQAGVQPLTDADRRLYEALGVPLEPFRSVQYYAPCKEDGVTPNTLRTNPEVSGNVFPLAWGLQDIIEYAEVVLNRDDLDAKADALIQFINQTVIGDKDGYQIEGSSNRIHVRSFSDLENWFRKVLQYVENKDGGKGQEQYRTHHSNTIRKVHNRLSNLTTRYKGLLTSDRPTSDLPWGEFTDRAIYVVDIAGMDSQGQDLVVTRIVSKLKEHLEKNTLGVRKCVVVVDELNKYAPGDGPDTYLKKTLLDISERGRYIGLVLFSAQQFRSQVHKRVVGNCGTSIYGRMDMDELATPGYQVLSRAEREKLGTLSKGQLLVRHPHFSQPIFVKFPRPNILRGADGIKLFPPEVDRPFEEVLFDEMRRMNPSVRRNQVQDLMVNADIEQAKNALALLRRDRPEDPLSAFARYCRKKANLEETPEPRGFGAPDIIGDDVNPFED